MQVLKWGSRGKNTDSTNILLIPYTIFSNSVINTNRPEQKYYIEIKRSTLLYVIITDEIERDLATKSITEEEDSQSPPLWNSIVKVSLFDPNPV